jgi:voltage-gated potassium channel
VTNEQERYAAPGTQESPGPGKSKTRDRSRLVDALLLATVLIFLGAYAWPILRPELSDGWRTVCHWASWLTWGVFALDYVVRLIRADDRGRYVRSNLFTLATVVLPFFRPLQMLRLMTVMSVLNRRATVSLRGQVTTYAAGAAALLMFCGALAVLDAERGAAGATIKTFPDAVWWTFATVTTVGYGDFFPVTLTGRIVAVLLMIAGIAVLGVVSASLASWFIERVSAADAEQEAATRREIHELTELIRAQQRQLEEQRELLAQVAARTPARGEATLPGQPGA